MESDRSLELVFWQNKCIPGVLCLTCSPGLQASSIANLWPQVRKLMGPGTAPQLLHVSGVGG